MPRPSLKDAKSKEILDAFVRCAARFGLDGSTLERIADEAGIQRPMIRHYLGNRDQMIAKLLDHVESRFDDMTNQLFGALPASGRVKSLLSYLFDPTYHAPENGAVFQALVAASDRYPQVRAPLLNFVRGFEERVAHEISKENPEADPQKIQLVSSAVTSIYFSAESVMPLDPGRAWLDRQKMAAQMLIDAL